MLRPLVQSDYPRESVNASVFRKSDRVCYSETMKLLLTIRHVLATLALLGLVLSPLAWPVMAMDSGGMAQGVDMAGNAATDMTDMPCCPDGAPKPDCAKVCPLLAMCMAKTFQSTPYASGPVRALTIAHTVLPRDDAKLHGIAQAPPPRPPDA